MKIRIVLAALAATLIAAGVRADDFYFHVPFRSLQITEGTLPRDSVLPSKRWQMLPAMSPYAVLDGAGEIYISGEAFQSWGSARSFYDSATVAIRASTNRVTGRLFVANDDCTGMVPLKFSVTAAQSKPESKQEFARARASHYRRLQQRNIPGSAWFRQQAGTAPEANTPQNWNRRPRLDNMEDTFELFSG